MTTQTKVKPIVRAPAGACDTHMHVFGPREIYPPATTERYVSPFAPLENYLEEMDEVGIERIVVVQPSAYGLDNSCALDTLRRLGKSGRGIMHLSEQVTDEELQAWHALGVRGIRINTSPVRPYDPAYAAALLPQIARVAERLEPLGWCIEFLCPGWLTETLLPVMRRLPVNYILCHIGMVKASEGVGQPLFRQILRLTETGRCWIKLTGLYRFSALPDYADAEPFFRALAGACPERLIWGSDHPHLSFADRTDTVALYNCLCRWIDDEATRRRVLVDNPAALFGFE